jgi:hypothetical protein
VPPAPAHTQPAAAAAAVVDAAAVDGGGQVGAARGDGSVVKEAVAEVAAGEAGGPPTVHGLGAALLAGARAHVASARTWHGLNVTAAWREHREALKVLVDLAAQIIAMPFAEACSFA